MKKVIWLCVVVMFLSSFAGLATASAESALKKVSSDLIGTRYKYGGTTTRGFDCSGLISYIYKKFGVKLPHQSRSMAKLGKRIKKSELKPGDLVFFKEGRSKRISHVGVYIGGGRFIHASSSRGVVSDKMSDKHWVRDFVMARRVLNNTQLAKVNSDSKVQLASASKKTVAKKAPAKKAAPAKSVSSQSKKSNAESKTLATAKKATASQKKTTAKKSSVKKSVSSKSKTASSKKNNSTKASTVKKTAPKTTTAKATAAKTKKAA